MLQDEKLAIIIQKAIGSEAFTVSTIAENGKTSIYFVTDLATNQDYIFIIANDVCAVFHNTKSMAIVTESTPNPQLN